MVSGAKSKKVLLSTVLLKLCDEATTGVLSVQGKRRTVKFYFKSGHVVYAEGMDSESQLLKQVAEKKKLDPNELDALEKIKERDPHGFGEALVERKLVSRTAWSKFLQLKMRHILGVALQMDTPHLGFSESEWSIPASDLIDYNVPQLVADAIKGIRKLEHFKRHIPGDDLVFVPSDKAEDVKGSVPLSPAEQTIFTMVDGQNTVRSIMEASDLDEEDIYRILYLLLCLDLITPVSEEGIEGQQGVNYTEIVDIYVDLLKILETNLRKELGNEFETIFNTCKNELAGESKELLFDFNLDNPPRQEVVKAIYRRFAREGKVTEGKLLLLSSFNKLSFLLLMKMRNVLGVGLTESTLEEMMKMLEYLEKYRQDAQMMDYLRENLKDYLQQIRA